YFGPARGPERIRNIRFPSDASAWETPENPETPESTPGGFVLPTQTWGCGSLPGLRTVNKVGNGVLRGSARVVELLQHQRPLPALDRVADPSMAAIFILTAGSNVRRRARSSCVRRHPVLNPGGER